MYITIITKIILCIYSECYYHFFFSETVKPISLLRPYAYRVCYSEETFLSSQGGFFPRMIFSYLTDEYMLPLPTTFLP